MIKLTKAQQRVVELMQEGFTPYKISQNFAGMMKSGEMPVMINYSDLCELYSLGLVGVNEYQIWCITPLGRNWKHEGLNHET